MYISFVLSSNYTEISVHIPGGWHLYNGIIFRRPLSSRFYTYLSSLHYSTVTAVTIVTHQNAMEMLFLGARVLTIGRSTRVKTFVDPFLVVVISSVSLG